MYAEIRMTSTKKAGMMKKNMANAASKISMAEATRPKFFPKLQAILAMTHRDRMSWVTHTSPTAAKRKITMPVSTKAKVERSDQTMQTSIGNTDTKAQTPCIQVLFTSKIFLRQKLVRAVFPAAVV